MALRNPQSVQVVLRILPWLALFAIAGTLLAVAPKDAHYGLFLTAAPFFAAAVYGPHVTALFGVVTIALYNVVHATLTDSFFGTVWWIQLALVTATCAIGVLSSGARQRERDLDRTREMAFTLQRELLPLGIVSTANVEICNRYKPADTQAGVGGDWFDTIPLGGSRIALTIGDVVGHGVRAAAMMGKVRAAVQTLGDMDLAPGELLGRLDNMAARLGELDASRDLSATCLYLVYDPVTRKATMASAGHPPPALRRPDRSVEFPQLPEHPPLGMGGTAFENTTISVPEGGILALYTDGMLDLRHCVAEDAFGHLGSALAKDIDDLEQLCAYVTDTVRGDPKDDVALLLARVTGKHRDDVATWVLPAEPTAVGRARNCVTLQLKAWNLPDKAFHTEVIATELLTNALLHASAPITLRLIKDSSLICEVSDCSRTFPHLLPAYALDECGRGLQLVARLSSRWGTRYTRTGKVVWAEQALPVTPACGRDGRHGHDWSDGSACCRSSHAAGRRHIRSHTAGRRHIPPGTLGASSSARWAPYRSSAKHRTAPPAKSAAQIQNTTT
jgi:hypothetical protein